MKSFFAVAILASLLFTVQAQQLCSVLGTLTGGICTDPADFQTITFCTGVDYKACIIYQNATEADILAQQDYDATVGTLADNEACKTGLKNYICGTHFPKCDQGSSTELCLSTCQNFLTACELDKKQCTDTENTYGQNVEQNKKLPCTSSAFIVVPQILLVAIAFIIIF